MVSSVYFNDESAVAIEEIYYEIAYNVLASEL